MKKILLNAGFILTAVWIALIIMEGKNILLGFKEPIDFYADDFDINENHDGERISADIPLCLGECATHTVTKTSHGSTSKTKTSYYVIPAVAPNVEYYFYICIEVKEKDRDKFEKLTNLTLNGEYGSIKVDGKLKKLENKAYEYMIEVFEEAEFFESKEELDFYVLPLCFEDIDFGFAKGCFIAIIISFIGSIAVWISYFVSLSKEKKMIAANKATFQANYPTQNFEDNVVICGKPYPKHLFESVNNSLKAGENIAAISTLRQITGISLEEAKEVIDNWCIYYY